MAEGLRRSQPVSVANLFKARQSLIERAVTWLATESGWARSKRSAICSGKLCGGFIIFEQCCPRASDSWRSTANKDFHKLKKAVLLKRMIVEFPARQWKWHMLFDLLSAIESTGFAKRLNGMRSSKLVVRSELVEMQSRRTTRSLYFLGWKCFP